jgi:hypothetical protein
MDKFNFNRAWAVKVIVRLVEAKQIVNFLIESEAEYTNGSSFAVTSEQSHPDYRAIYLTESSLNRLKMKFQERWNTDEDHRRH